MSSTNLTCPVCGCETVEIRCKAVCPKCGRIVATCCEGGRC